MTNVQAAANKAEPWIGQTMKEIRRTLYKIGEAYYSWRKVFQMCTAKLDKFSSEASSETYPVNG